MKRLRITIDNKSYEVTVEDLTGADAYPGSTPPVSAASSARDRLEPPASEASQPPTSGDRPKPQLPMDVGSVTSPMAGVIISVLVKQGEQVREHQPLVILEAMKMENQVTAPLAGTVKSVEVKQDDSVQEGQVLVVLE